VADLAQTVRPLAVPTAPLRRLLRALSGHLYPYEYAWAVAFCVPYAAMFLVFLVYPIGCAIWMGSDPALYGTLFADPNYQQAAINTAIYVGLGVNVKMLLALLLSGMFMRRGWPYRVMLMIFVLPWALPSWPAFMAIHWMLNGDYGLLNSFLWRAFGVHGPHWLIHYRLAFGGVMASYLWKYLPFSTVILLAGRMAIPAEIMEAAKIDGAAGWRLFRNVTFPMIGTLYLIVTLLSTIFAMGDFNTVYFVSGGGPANSTQVLATLSLRYMQDMYQPRLGVATALSVLPVLIPLVVLLMRKLRSMSIEQ
jgi:multiple sugar transport system permease protein